MSPACCGTEGRQRRPHRLDERKKPWPAIVISVVILAAIAFALLTRVDGSGASPYASAPPAPESGVAVAGAISGGSTALPVTAVDGIVQLPALHLADGQARHYVYTAGETAVPFFVLQSSDGVIRTALDACDVCYESRLGYRQEGDAMVCNNCGTRFSSTQISEVRGGCNPAPLERTIEGDTILIEAAELESGVRYFGVAS